MTERGAPLGDRYLLGERLAGTVWRCVDRTTGATRAVRFLPRAEAPEDVPRHRHLVAVHDRVTDGDRVALVTDLITGENLTAYAARRGPLPPAEAAWLTSQVAEALAALHATGRAHGALEPDAVLLDHTDRSAPVRVTTPRTADPTPADDVHAIGLLLHTLLTPPSPATNAESSRTPDGDSPAPDDWLPAPTGATLAADSPATSAGGSGTPGTRSPAPGGAALAPGGDTRARVGPAFVLDGPLGALVERCRTERPGDRPEAADVARELADYARVHQVKPFVLAPRRPSPASLLSAAFAGVSGAGFPCGPDAVLPRRTPLLLCVGAAVAAVALAAGVTLTLTTASARDARANPPHDRRRLTDAARAADWRCGPRSSAGGRELRACVRTDGHRLYLRGTVTPVAPGDDVRVTLVLRTAAGRDVQSFTSPPCATTVCTFETSAVPPRRAYRALPAYSLGGTRRATGPESPAVTF
ncbi:Serine/threonine-protein kinase PrkC [Actinomadura rubteroloni]|uniref:Serine/threonine-protein kinase PrkC n=1 Tax=Actinomadura rubteroloni TaxID=1926885 RepID=A0A2P4UJG8_9ACTN|nr:protein kinase [Actinomadura rubteroloni]POM25205.1 Serine/threonine-protein kinase PrkC [Actinomadura rubteroloni]